MVANVENHNNYLKMSFHDYSAIIPKILFGRMWIAAIIPFNGVLLISIIFFLFIMFNFICILIIDGDHFLVIPVLGLIAGIIWIIYNVYNSISILILEGDILKINVFASLKRFNEFELNDVKEVKIKRRPFFYGIYQIKIKKGNKIYKYNLSPPFNQLLFYKDLDRLIENLKTLIKERLILKNIQ